MTRIERAGPIIWLALATIAFFWIVSPFRSALIWALAGSTLFSPLNHWLVRRLGGRRNPAAALTVIAMIFALVVPAIGAGIAIIREAAALISQKTQGRIFPSLDQIYSALPEWLRHLLHLLGSNDALSFQRQVGRLFEGGVSALFGGLIGVGQGAFGFAVSLGIMLYVSFFLLRDGRAICMAIVAHLPFPERMREHLIHEVIDVLRATLRGSLVVAIAQGVIGGLVFWLLGIEAPAIWAFAMAFMSLFPPFGTGAIWVPMALFLLLTGAIRDGIILALCGLFVIGLIDNLIRPLLVGKQASLPEYLVLISTLGGLALLGLDGIIVGPLIVSIFLSSWRMIEAPALPISAPRADEPV